MTLRNDQLRRIFAAYGLQLEQLLSVQSGYRNTSYIIETKTHGIKNCIVYKDEPEIVSLIRRVNEFSSFVSRSDLPLRLPVDPRILTLTGSTTQRYCAIYTFLHGDTIPWEAYTKKHIKLLGYALGRFHAEARSYTGSLPDVVDEYQAILIRMKRYFSDPATLGAAERKLGVHLVLSFERTAGFLEECRALPAQPLHMDFVRGNVLFRPAETGDVFVIDELALSGILDLEKAAYGPVLFDVARTLAFLLVDCPKPAAKIYRYFIDSGYVKRGNGLLQRSESQVLERLVTMFLAYDFYKFLKQNPYESLVENHHYQRTRDILLKRKVLQLI